MRRRRRRFEAGAAVTQFSDLKAGDYIVHEVHGVGRYLGLKRFAGKAGDYMALQYAGGDTVYVPITHIDQIQKFAGGEGALPKMDRIGGASWRGGAAREEAVREMTDALVRPTPRGDRAGPRVRPGHPWQREFEDASSTPRRRTRRGPSPR